MSNCGARLSLGSRRRSCGHPAAPGRVISFVSMMEGPIGDLVRRFEEHRAAYLSGHYNETQLRREFLDPFFEALGWDVNNRKGYAEAYGLAEDEIKLVEGKGAL